MEDHLGKIIEIMQLQFEKINKQFAEAPSPFAVLDKKFDEALESAKRGRGGEGESLITEKTQEQKKEKENELLNRLCDGYFDSKADCDNFVRKCLTYKKKGLKPAYMSDFANFYYESNGVQMYRDVEKKEKLMTLLMELKILPPSATYDTFRKKFNK